MELPEKITWGDKYGKGVEITDPKEAAEYFEACVQHQMTIGGFSREQATIIEQKNFGYWAGYYDSATFDRVMKLYGCAHPIFGTQYPTLEAAYNTGKKN